MKSEILKKYYLFKEDNIKEVKSILKKLRIMMYILKKE